MDARSDYRHNSNNIGFTLQEREGDKEMTKELINELTDTYVRYPELLFGDGKIYQREIDCLNQTRFVDITEDVAMAISEYLKKED